VHPAYDNNLEGASIIPDRRRGDIAKDGTSDVDTVKNGEVDLEGKISDKIAEVISSHRGMADCQLAELKRNAVYVGTHIPIVSIAGGQSWP